MPTTRTSSPFQGGERLLEPGLIEQTRLAWRLFRDPRVPAIKQAIPVLAAIYVLSPIDLIPDFLLGLGQFDDLGILIAGVIAAINLLPKLAPPEITAEHLAAIRGQAPAASEPMDEQPTGAGTVYEGKYRVRN